MLVQLQRLRMIWDRYAPLIIFLAVALTFVLLAPHVGWAAVPPGVDVPVGPDAKVDSLFDLDPFMVEIIGGTLIPFLVAFVSSPNTKAWVKKAATIVLSAANGMLTVGMTEGGGSVISVASVKAAVLTAMSALLAYWITIRNSATETKLVTAGPNLLPEG